MDVEALDKEIIKGTECSVIEITIEMEMETEGGALTMTLKEKEWRDEIGIPYKIEGEIALDLIEMELTFSSESRVSQHVACKHVIAVSGTERSIPLQHSATSQFNVYLFSVIYVKSFISVSCRCTEVNQMSTIWQQHQPLQETQALH